MLQAFIAFENSEDARRATQKDREIFGDKWGGRYVRVYPTLELDLPDLRAAAAGSCEPTTQVRTAAQDGDIGARWGDNREAKSLLQSE
jgi:hypothetical protein